MIKFFRHIRKDLTEQNKRNCHSALDVESTNNGILNQVQDDKTTIL